MISKDETESALERSALAQFDSLVKKGEIFWEPTEEVVIQQEPFDVGSIIPGIRPSHQAVTLHDSR